MMRLNLGLSFSRKGDKNKDLEEFIRVLLKIKSREEMEDFLRGVLTPKELLELPNRLKIVKMLKNGTSQHEIAENLGVGVATVTRGSMELQKGRFKNV
jgi:TrpR family trp operon transcriptional repressor